MSRIVVKNLPQKLKEEKLRSLFSSVGHITDLSLKFTKDGVFRKFAFIGFSKEEDGEKAIEKFNRTFVDASKIQVELCRDLYDSDKPRAWSKYAKGSSAYNRMLEKLEAKKAERSGEKIEQKEKPKEQNVKEKKKKAREKKVEEMLGELKDDDEFQDFLQIHKNRKNKALWGNDMLIGAGVEETSNPATGGGSVVGKKHSDDDSGSSSGSGSESERSDSEEDDGAQDSKKVKSKGKAKDDVALKKGLSDLDYLKSKVSKSSQLLAEDSSESESSSSSEDENEEETKKEQTSASPGERKKPASTAMLRVKIKGLPTTVKEKQIKDFFQGIPLKSIHLPRNAQHKPMGVAYAEFSNENDFEQALQRNKSFIGSKKIFLKKAGSEGMGEATSQEQQIRPWEAKLLKQKAEGKDEDEDETIAESGRLFVRNLAYICTEEDLESLFKKYGPITDINLPIDKFTKKIKGFAFVTFMMPEHAVKAFMELDGKIFQGRLLHILPAKTKEEKPAVEGTDTFKKKRAADKKALSGSSHNWNTLFLGANAVADVMAEKYGKSKSDILDAESRESLGVRMALGETQIVAETRDFLIDNGVSLDAFSQANAPRSKSVILVKNLPAGTKAEEIKDVFAKHGTLGRIILPPSGITAIVEFSENTEAKTAFRSLAYSKFQHVPLYLEWAPCEVFKKERPVSMETDEQQGGPSSEAKKDAESSSDEDEPEPDTTVFVKNINFETTDESLEEKFAKIGPVHSASIARKKDMKNPGQLLSMGYGFVQFKTKAAASKALKELQHTELDEHTLELKLSNRQIAPTAKTKRKEASKKVQKSTKIMVRNIPFEAKLKEIEDLFKVFGEIKSVRLPKKLTGTGSHRGFGFVDFLTKQDAKRAFNAMCHSTHLYGRRLVLEWADENESVTELRKKTAEHFHDDVPRKKLKKSSLMEDLKGGDASD